MEVAVVSKSLSLGVSSLGPTKAKVMSLDRYEPAHGTQAMSRRTKTIVRLWNFNTSTWAEQDYYLDGKNIKGPWKDFEANFELARDQQVFDRQKAELTRRYKEEEMTARQERAQRVINMLDTLGISATTGYGGAITIPAAAMERTEEIVAKAMIEKSLKI